MFKIFTSSKSPLSYDRLIMEILIKDEKAGCSAICFLYNLVTAMPAFKVKLLKKTEIADGTMAFEFEKPTGFQFRAGQFCEFKLLNPLYNDTEGDLRPLSLTSAPFEENLMIAMRMRNTAFKNSLKEMPIGSELAMEGPFGSLTLHVRSERPAVILTGGIGITPFRSIIKQALHEKLPHKIFLFYSNRRPADAPFLGELDKLQSNNFKLSATMTDLELSDDSWKGERGYIDRPMLDRFIDNESNPVYYIAGPAPMVASMWQMLKLSGISEDDIKTEEFPGY